MSAPAYSGLMLSGSKRPGSALVDSTSGRATSAASLLDYYAPPSDVGRLSRYSSQVEAVTFDSPVSNRYGREQQGVDARHQEVLTEPVTIYTLRADMWIMGPSVSANPLYLANNFLFLLGYKNVAPTVVTLQQLNRMLKNANEITKMAYKRAVHDNNLDALRKFAPRSDATPPPDSATIFSPMCYEDACFTITYVGLGASADLVPPVMANRYMHDRTSGFLHTGKHKATDFWTSRIGEMCGFALVRAGGQHELTAFDIDKLPPLEMRPFLLQNRRRCYLDHTSFSHRPLGDDRPNRSVPAGHAALLGTEVEAHTPDWHMFCSPTAVKGYRTRAWRDADRRYTSAAQSAAFVDFVIEYVDADDARRSSPPLEPGWRVTKVLRMPHVWMVGRKLVDKEDTQGVLTSRNCQSTLDDILLDTEFGTAYSRYGADFIFLGLR